ncbi:MAG: hypothetical protein Q4A30_00785 [Candidatus Saccharibacteria bacterium]|nr:hypothetical protein [Candidatus Saccharibacteria bacterium]
MKPKNTALNTDFYQLANNNSAEISLNISSGTSANYWSGAILASKTFSAGSPLSDYDGLIFDNKNGTWSAGTSKNLNALLEQRVNGTSYGTYSSPLEIRFFRTSGSSFTLQVAVTGLGGVSPNPPRPSVMFYLRENIEVRLKLKTFLQPEL